LNRCCAGILLLAMLAGCGGGQESTVTGTVTFDGQPLTTGAVTFHPLSEGPLAIGQIDAAGAYSLSTGNEEGLAAGDYRVTVVATGPMPEPTPQNPEPLPELLIPAKYGASETAGLQFTVRPGSNHIDIPLAR
jgi:hypothetical protein